MSGFITIADARRIVDACGGSYTRDETESRFGEGYTAALDAADKALAEAVGRAPTEALNAIIKGIRENIPMDYLERHPGDLVAAMRDYAKDRWALIDRIAAANAHVAALQSGVA